MKNLPLVLGALSAAFAANCLAAGWTAEVAEGGLRTARTTGSVVVGDIGGSAMLQLACLPGADGSVSWRLELDDPDRYANFGLDEFEGPDAAALNQVLTTLGLQGGGIKFAARSAVNGFYDGNPSRFVLEFSAAANASSQAALVADAVSPLTTAIVWTTRSVKQPTLSLQAEFDTASVGNALFQTMLGCGPAPELPREFLQHWEDRTPAESGLWSQRAVLWRLAGLLGREWPTLLERMQVAEPLHHDGDVFFVSGHRADHEDEAAVVMFDTRSRNYDVVLIAAQKSVRYSSNKAIDAPSAVREFIAGKIGGK